jgi:hypothetical protein
MQLSAKYIWTIVIVGILAVGIGGWFGRDQKGHQESQPFRNEEKDSQQSEKSISQFNEIDDTSDWQVYRNEQLGFEVKYPSDWKAVEKAGDNSDRSVVSFVSPETQRGIDDRKISYSCDLSIYYYPSVSDEPGNSLKTNDLEEMIADSHYIEKIGQAHLGGKASVDVILGGYGAYYTIFTVQNNHLYKIFFCNKETKESLTEIDKKILNSFRFLE